MSNFAPYANYGYVALIKEVTAWVPVVPSNFLRILSESIEVNFWVSNVQEIAWSRERNIRSVQNQIDVAWDIEFYIESKMIWHFLRWIYGSPVSQILTAGKAFRHVFSVTDTPRTYTIDIKPADAPWVHRFYWVQINELQFEPDDNKMKCTASLMPRKAFINARVTTAVSSGTTLTLDQTSWLTSSDTIIILRKEDWFTTVQELSITSVDSDTQITTDTITTPIDVDDIVVIKRSTAVYDQDKIFTWLGGSQIFTGDDIDNTSVEDKENFSLTYTNEVEARYFAGLEESARFAGDVLVKWYQGAGQVDKFYDSESNLDKLRKNEKMWLRLLSSWEVALEVNIAIKSSSTWGATANGFKIEASAGWKAWNDINITILIADDDTLAVTKTWNNIIINLANTTSSKNTGTLIAAAIDALTWVDGTAEGTGAEEFTIAEDNQNLGFRIDSAGAEAWTNIVGRDASEKPYIQFDNAAAKLDIYSPSASEDDLLIEEIPLTFYKDVESGDTSKKWSTRILLVNSVSSY